jgi:hypothetical protein
MAALTIPSLSPKRERENRKGLIVLLCVAEQERTMAALTIPSLSPKREREIERKKKTSRY